MIFIKIFENTFLWIHQFGQFLQNKDEHLNKLANMMNGSNANIPKPHEFIQDILILLSLKNKEIGKNFIFEFWEIKFFWLLRPSRTSVQGQK